MTQSALAGEVAWVTGGARGIGRAVALALARDGAVVHVTDVLDCADTVRQIEDAGGAARGHALDVTDPQRCRYVADAIVERDGAVHMLVCNAGVCPPGEVVGDDAQWRRVLAVNLDGTRNPVNAAWPVMQRQGGGRIVIVSSMAYYRGGIIVGTEYSASKAALIGMTRHLARNGGPLGIRCNAVAPGIIETDMTAGFDKPDPASIPLRRLGCADDVAGPVAFLCGPESAYMTGTVLNVTGGMVLSA